MLDFSAQIRFDDSQALIRNLVSQLTEIRSNFYQKLCDRWTFFRGKSAYEYREELLSSAENFLRQMVSGAGQVSDYTEYSDLQKEFEEVHEIRHSILHLQISYLEHQAQLLNKELDYVSERLSGAAVEGSIYQNHVQKVSSELDLIQAKQRELNEAHDIELKFPLFNGLQDEVQQPAVKKKVMVDDAVPIRPVFPLDQLTAYFQNSFERMHDTDSNEARYEFLETLWKVVHEICEYRDRRNPTSFELYSSSLRPLLDLVHSYFHFDMEQSTENYDQWCHRLYALWDSSDRYDVNSASLLLFEALIYMCMYEDKSNAAYQRLERVFQEVYACIYDDFLSMIVDEDDFLAQVNGEIKKLYEKVTQRRVYFQ